MENDNKDLNFPNSSNENLTEQENQNDVNLNFGENTEKESQQENFVLYNNQDESFNQDEKTSEDKFVLSDDSLINFNSEDNEDLDLNSKKKKVKTKRRKSKIIIFFSIILIVSILLATGAIVIINDFLAIFKGDQEIIIEIPSNTSATQIAQQLQDEGVINFSLVFRLYSKINNEDSDYKLGIHKLNTKMSYEQIIAELQKTAKQQDAVDVTFPEGYNLVQISKLLQEKGVVSSWKDFMDTFNRQSFGTKIEENIPRDAARFNQKEGYAFPDTYTFYLNEDVSSVAKRLLNNFSEKVDPLKTKIEEGMAKYNLTYDQVITLASIIQAESSDVEHMNQVAGVFHNRLKNSVAFPKLQSDPTTFYANNVIKALSQVENQEMINSYDTYTAIGLPPGAICSPGVDAILAAVSPEESEYYYFVTDKDGNFYFAKTYDEHRANCKKAGITVAY